MTASAPAPARPLSDDELQLLDAYWRAANYLSVGQIYLLDNPLLRGRSGRRTSSRACSATGARRPGLNMLYVHMNRVIKARDLDAIYIIGPGHGGPAIVANAYLEGTYSEVYPSITRDEEGIRKLFRQFTLPGRHPEPRRARDAGLDPRGRRARLRAEPRVRRRVRQPGPRRVRGRRRRRGGDRPARHELALEQVPQPGDATARSCRSSTSTATRSPTPRCSPGSRARS